MTDINHHYHIDTESRDIAKNAVKKSESNDERLNNLEIKFKRLSIINEALYEILVTRLNLTENELSTMIAQVIANRASRAEAKSSCRNCGRSVPLIKQKCMYCGGELLGELSTSLFDRDDAL